MPDTNPYLTNSIEIISLGALLSHEEFHLKGKACVGFISILLWPCTIPA